MNIKSWQCSTILGVKCERSGVVLTQRAQKAIRCNSIYPTPTGISSSLSTHLL